MTPPPMMTTCARAGMVRAGGAPVGNSVAMQAFSVSCPHVGEQSVEVWAAELLHGVVEALHGPVPEVEVEHAGAVLNATPQGPPVLRDRPLQPGSCEFVAQRTAVVTRHQFAELVEGEPTFAPDVAQ